MPKVKKMSAKEINDIVDEWHSIWLREAKAQGKDTTHLISKDYLKEQAQRDTYCRECGIPCSSYGYNKRGEPVCLYCKAEKGEFEFAVLPTHGVPFYLYVAKHRDFCRKTGNCEGCNGRQVCDRLDKTKPSILSFF